MSQDLSYLSLRVKRRRDAEAAPELVLETSRSAGRVPKLAASLQQALAVSNSHQGSSSAAAEVPAKKRCRFVLVPAAADSVAGTTAAATRAAAGQEQGVAGPVLELWHTSAAERSSTAAQHAASGHSPQPEPDAQERAVVYAAMVQQYLQEQQQQQVPTSTQQQRVCHRPSKRGHCSTSAPSCQQQAQEQQEHQQGPQLPAYMTAGMLKQYGLWQGLHAQTQQQQQGTTSQPDAATAAAAASTDDLQDTDYAYDMYVAAAAPEDGTAAAGAAAPCAGMDPSNCQPQGADMRPGTPDATTDLPVIQVWEDELLQLQENWALGQDAAAEPESEDSNAEDFVGNEYPDESDGSYQDSMDSLDTEDEQEGAVSRPYRGGLGSSSGIGFYQPGGSAGGISRRGAGRGVRAHTQQGGGAFAAAEGGYGSEGSFDVEDYVSSGDEQGEAREEDAGPAWLRKHCTAYGTDSGGQAWRSVLAQQFAP